MLKRSQMEKIIREGGSVLHDGKVVTDVNQLPSDADLSKGDEAEQDRLIAGYERQIADLQAAKQAIYDARASKDEPAKAEAPKAEAAPDKGHKPAPAHHDKGK